MKTVSIPTDQGSFHAHLLGDAGSWVICWPAQPNDYKSMLEFAKLISHQHRVVICEPMAIGANHQLPYSNKIAHSALYAKHVFVYLGIEACHWVGQSAGGAVGAAICAAAPARILSLTLASAPMLRQGRFLMAATFSTAVLSSSRWGRALLLKRSIKLLGYAGQAQKLQLLQYLQTMFDATPPKTIRKMRPLDGESVRALFDKLRAKPPRTLVICGQFDGVVLPRDQRTVAETLRAKYLELPCGHLSILALPQECADAFLSFAAQHSAALRDSQRVPLNAL
jgi:pimeloyl-ACP methyl ester carboxylesterase